MNSEQAVPRTHRALLSDDVVSSVLSFLAPDAGRAVYPACKLYRELWRRRCAGLLRVLRSPVGDFGFSERVVAYGDGALVPNYRSNSLKTYSASGDHVSDLLLGTPRPTALALRGDGTAWILLGCPHFIVCARLDDPTYSSAIMEINPERLHPDFANGDSCRVCDIGLAGDRLLILSSFENFTENHPKQFARVHVVDDGSGAILYQFRTDLLEYESGLFAVQDDMLYVAGFSTNVIHIYNWRQGSAAGLIRPEGDLAFRMPWGVAVSGKMLYVSEQGDWSEEEDVPGRIWILRLPDDVSSAATVVQVIPSPDGAELGGLCLNGGQLWCMGPDERRTHMHLLGPCY